MRSDVIIIACVRLQNLTQMHLAQDNDVVYTLTPDRSDQPFGKAILPRRGWRGGLVPDAHGAQSARDDAAIDPVPIADEVVRSRGGHYGQRSCEPHLKAGHMAAPTNAAKREESPCQPGAVHTWHFSDMAGRANDVGSWG